MVTSLVTLSFQEGIFLGIISDYESVILTFVWETWISCQNNVEESVCEICFWIVWGISVWEVIFCLLTWIVEICQATSLSSCPNL